MSARTEVATFFVLLVLESVCPRTASALRLSPESVDFELETRRRSIAGSIALHAAVDRIDLQLGVDAFTLKKLVVRVLSISAEPRAPRVAVSAAAGGVGVKQIRIGDGAVHLRFRRFRAPDRLLSDLVSIEYAQSLQPGDRLYLSVRKGRGGQTVTSTVAPEPGTATLVLLGLALLGTARRRRQ